MAISPEHIPKQPDLPIPELSIVEGSSEPFLNARTESYLANIAREASLSPAQRASLIASGVLDNISLALSSERTAWPSADDLLDSYEIASYLCDTRKSDETDIVIEIFDEELHAESVPPIYGNILDIAEKSAKRLTLGKSGEIASMMIRLWLVTEAEIEIPSMFAKIRGRAMARMAIGNGRSGFRV